MPTGRRRAHVNGLSVNCQGHVARTAARRPSWPCALGVSVDVGLDEFRVQSRTGIERCPGDVRTAARRTAILMGSVEDCCRCMSGRRETR